MYACFGLIHLLHTESMQSETPRQLCQRVVRLHVNSVNAEAPTFMESTWSLSYLALTQLMGMRLCITQVTAES
jgi:hypothetical protein